MVLSRGRWPRNSEPRRVGRTRLGVGGMRDGQIAVGPLAPRSHAFLTPSPVPPSSLFFSSPLSLPFFLFLAPYFSPTNAFIRVRFSFEPKRLTVYRPTARFNARALSLSLSLFPSPLYLLALSLFTCLVSSPIARSIPSTEIHRDSFGILPFLSSPFPPFFFLLSFELSRLEKEKRNVSFIVLISGYFRSRIVGYYLNACILAFDSFSFRQRGKKYNSPSFKAGG